MCHALLSGPEANGRAASSPTIQSLRALPDPKVQVVDDDKRLDRLDHLPKRMDGKFGHHCQVCHKGRSRFYCLKCRVYLCIGSRDCYYDYHVKSARALRDRK